MPKNQKIEDILHKQICIYIKTQYPKIIFNTDLSGIRLTIGQAKKLKSLRSSKSFPDIIIYYPNNNYHGLFLEVKKECPYKKDNIIKNNEHLIEQKTMINALMELKYFACFVWGFDMAKDVIDRYINNNI